MTEVMTLQEEIQHHLEYNLTIPVPDTHIEDMVRICVDAITAVNAHELDRMVNLGEWVSVNRVSDGAEVHECPAWEVVRRFRLDKWLKSEWQ